MNTAQSNPVQRASGRALLPFAVFITLSLGSGVLLLLLKVERPFSRFPAVVAAYLACCSCFLLFEGSMEGKLATFLQGMGRPNILNMCIIFMVAGGFSAVTTATGGVDSVVNLCLSLLPVQVVTAGIFLVGCAVSFASGTSMGTVVTLTPIALSLAEKTGVALPVMLGAVLSGAMFGNNLSPLSAATIAAVGTQNVEVRDKTRVNMVLALPALLLSALLFLLLGRPESAAAVEAGSFQLVKLLPYIVMLWLAIKGVGVAICVTLGTFAAGLIGLADGTLTPLALAQCVSDGMLSMAGMVFLSLLLGGMAHMVEQEGGIQFLIEKMRPWVKNWRSAQLVGMGLVFLVSCCVANDTIACIIGGGIAKDISRRYRVDPRKMAALVQIVACTTVVLIPYSGLMLTLYGMMEAAGHSVSFVQALPYTLYPLLLCLTSVASIFLPSLDRLFNAIPWDYENDRPREGGQLTGR